MAAWIELLQLCSAATYRDGLLSVLEAGITHLSLAELPARPQLTVVAQLAFTEPDTDHRHAATVDVVAESGKKVAWVATEVDPTRPEGADLAFPFVFVVVHNLLLELDEEGLYTITASLGPDVRKHVGLRVKRSHSA